MTRQSATYRKTTPGLFLFSSYFPLHTLFWFSIYSSIAVLKILMILGRAIEYGTADNSYCFYFPVISRFIWIFFFVISI